MEKTILTISDVREVTSSDNIAKLALILQKEIKVGESNGDLLDVSSFTFEGVVNYQYIVNRENFAKSLGANKDDLQNIVSIATAKKIALYTFDIRVCDVYEGKTALRFLASEYSSFADKEQFHIATNKERTLKEVQDSVTAQIKQGIDASLWALV